MVWLIRLILSIMLAAGIVLPSFAVSSAHKHVVVTKKKQQTTKKKIARHKKTKKQHQHVHVVHKKKPVKHRQPQIYDETPDVVSLRNTPEKATDINPTMHYGNAFNNSVTKHLVEFVHKTVDTLHYSVYKMGGKHFDAQRGVYILDCSGFVDKILQKTCPNAYSSLVGATGADSPASQHYYHFFNELSSDQSRYWNKVDNLDQLQPGDILVMRYKNSRGIETGGHVMVVMNKPEQDTDVFYVRVADSAPTRHSDDTREHNTSGIGIGTLLLKASSRTGQPIAYAWGIGGYWNKNANFAMARPTEVTAVETTSVFHQNTNNHSYGNKFGLHSFV